MKKHFVVVLVGSLAMVASWGRNSRPPATAGAPTVQAAVPGKSKAPASASPTGIEISPQERERIEFSLPSSESSSSPGPLALSQAQPPSFDLQKVVAETEELLKKIPEDRYVLEARAKKLGAGVEPAFALVRDEIRLESYPGVLRGAAGTYLARAGNAADRSLLLARLLELKGVPARLAIGQLSTEDAERLFVHIFDPPRVAVTPAVPGTRASDASVSSTIKCRVET